MTSGGSRRTAFLPAVIARVRRFRSACLAKADVLALVDDDAEHQTMPRTPWMLVDASATGCRSSDTRPSP
ncbi:MAG: hypothetical protein ACLR4Z_07710 [Butyricicoccaceae bacterium]